MKKRISHFSTLLFCLALVLTACAPGNRDQSKDTVKPAEVTVTPEPKDSLKVGDIIFHKSKSQQSKAIREASQSEWTHVGILVSQNDQWFVAEAIGPVVLTPLEDFINRGKDKAFKIYRFKHFNAATMQDSLIRAIKKQNKDYDIYFEISDESTYCSELVYKAMLEVTGFELGQIQQFKDLKLNGPQVKALIKRRLTDKGRTLDPEEPIITPASQMNDANMILIKESTKAEF